MTATIETSVHTSQAQKGETIGPTIRTVRFHDGVDLLPPVDQLVEGEADQHEQEVPWFSPAEIASFREDAIRTVQALNACGGDETKLEEEDYCLRGLEKKMLKRPPPNFVRSLLRLQDHQRRTGKGGMDELTTSLQLFSIASSKWARKRSLQLGAEDEYDAYHIFMAGLHQYGNAQNDGDHDDNDDVDDQYDSDEEDDFAAFCEDEDFDFCTEGDFVSESDYINNVYDLKHSKYDSTEDETEYDESCEDDYDNMLVMMDSR